MKDLGTIFFLLGVVALGIIVYVWAVVRERQAEQRRKDARKLSQVL